MEKACYIIWKYFVRIVLENLLPCILSMKKSIKCCLLLWIFLLFVFKTFKSCLVITRDISSFIEIKTFISIILFLFYVLHKTTKLSSITSNSREQLNPYIIHRIKKGLVLQVNVLFICFINSNKIVWLIFLFNQK